LKAWSDLSVPVFPPGWSWHLTFGLRTQTLAGCQGFNGPFPSAFLDKKCIKELTQR
jgi:hypothetical protein